MSLNIDNLKVASTYGNLPVAFRTYKISATSTVSAASVMTEYDILSQTITIPDDVDISGTIYLHTLWTWFGEIINTNNENTMLDITVTYNGSTTVRPHTFSGIGSRGYGITTMAINFWREQASTPEVATVGGTVTLTGLTSRTLTVKLRYINTYSGTATIYTNRVANDVYGDSFYERGITTLACTFYK
jgi:hypothetical protein